MTNNKIEEIIKAIEAEYERGKVRKIGWSEIIDRLEKRGYKRYDIDDAIDLAERHKIIYISDGFSWWIEPERREEEKAKTQRYFDILSEIFENGKVKFLPRDVLKTALRERGLSENEIYRVLGEATRDHILDSHAQSFGPDRRLMSGFGWIPIEDRQMHAEADREGREWIEEWIDKKIRQEERTAEEEIKYITQMIRRELRKRKEMPYDELVEKFKGFDRDEVEEALDRVQRRKLVKLESGLLRWVKQDLRRSRRKAKRRF
ncbi:MAG: hypothetical protein QXF26_07400 [Candidatus Bathyarchaeia archaeon]